MWPLSVIHEVGRAECANYDKDFCSALPVCSRAIKLATEVSAVICDIFAIHAKNSPLFTMSHTQCIESLLFSTLRQVSQDEDLGRSDCDLLISLTRRSVRF
jgi:hypothetical protein